MYISHYGSYEFPQYNASDTFAQASVSGKLATLGKGAFDRQSTEIEKKEPREITKQFMVIANSPEACWEEVSYIRSMIASYERLYQLTFNNVRRWRMARIIEIVDSHDVTGSDSYCMVSLSFLCDDTPWFAENSHEGGEYIFDLGSGLGLITNTIYHLGNVLNEFVTVEVTATENMNGLWFTALTNPTGQVSVSYSVSVDALVLAGTTLTIDVRTKTIKNNGVGCYSSLNTWHNRPEWFGLFPGPNRVSVAFSSGSGTCKFLFDDAWA